MKIAIDIANTTFSEKWREICIRRGIDFIRCDLYSPNLMSELDGVTHLLAAPNLGDVKTSEFSKTILRNLEDSSIKVYPNQATFWHYDDKVAQKYLLESLNAPLIPSGVFYSKKAALFWVSNEAAYPFVFKLKCGAGSSNVKLMRSKSAAIAQVNKMFGRGEIPVPNYFSDFSTKARKTFATQNYLEKFKRFPKMIFKVLRRRITTPRERGYFYAQKFLSSNEFDTRVTIIGEKAFAYRRYNRKGDFRASGSGKISWEPQKVDRRCVALAVKLSQRLRHQTMAYDFIFDNADEPKIIEISYNFKPDLVSNCPGYWDRAGLFNEGKFNVQELILDDLVRE